MSKAENNTNQNKSGPDRMCHDSRVRMSDRIHRRERDASAQAQAMATIP
jgi:hypothetical protein